MDLNTAQSYLASITFGTRGLYARPPQGRQPPAQPLELFEFEACPFCRKVRATMSELDLPFVSRSCARGSNTREELPDGRRQFPYLRDPNTGAEMFESEDIIAYLHETYGDGAPRLRRITRHPDTLFAALASAVRPRGRVVRAGFEDREQPAEQLILFNFEASPFCRKVRERLHELNLDFLTKNVAKRSPSRPELVARGGRMMVPYLVDPNTGTEMYESDDIVAYLERTYGAG